MTADIDREKLRDVESRYIGKTGPFRITPSDYFYLLECSHALLALTDAQAAKIAELRAALAQEHANAMSMARVQNEMYDQQTKAFEAISAERDQLRKRGEERADWMRRAEETLKKLEIAASKVSRRGVVDGPQWSELTCALLRARTILSAVSALEQEKEQR